MPKSPTRLTMNALLAAVEARLPLVVEADQELGADAHQFPEHEHHRHVAGDHQPQHQKQNSDRYWKKRWNRPRPVEVLAVGERDRGSVTSCSSSCM